MVATTRAARPWWKRVGLGRLAMYVVLVLIVLLFVFFADFEKIQRNFFDWETIERMFPDVITIAAKNTVIATVLTFAIGLVLALLLALMKRSTIGPYRWFASGYIAPAAFAGWKRSSRSPTSGTARRRWNRC